MTTAVSETPVSTTQLQADIGMIRQAAKAAREIPVTFYRKPIAVVVPHDQRQRELTDLAELARLRAELATLRERATQEAHGSS